MIFTNRFVAPLLHSRSCSPLRRLDYHPRHAVPAPTLRAGQTSRDPPKKLGFRIPLAKPKAVQKPRPRAAHAFYSHRVRCTEVVDAKCVERAEKGLLNHFGTLREQCCR